MSPEALRRKSLLTLSVLGVLTLIAIGLFMTLGARGSWSFILPFRGTKLAALVLVAYAVSVSTVLFQTITNNRILTPSIMGFDALYMLLQTVLVFAFGSTVLATLDHRILFLIEVAVMLTFSLLLFRVLFGKGLRSLHLVLLVGIVFGLLFRSLSTFLQRLINPTDFVVLQDRFFASFNSVDRSLLLVSFLLVLAVTLVMIKISSTFDVLALGRETAISLGVDHHRMTMLILVLVSVLVSVSTALVGPVTFFGLLVANLAYILLPTSKHRYVLPAAVLISILCLVGGQTILERLLSFDTALSIVIEFAGGVFFILFLLKGSIR